MGNSCGRNEEVAAGEGEQHSALSEGHAATEDQENASSLTEAQQDKETTRKAIGWRCCDNSSRLDETDTDEAPVATAIEESTIEAASQDPRRCCATTLLDEPVTDEGVLSEAPVGAVFPEKEATEADTAKTNTAKTNTSKLTKTQERPLEIHPVNERPHIRKHVLLSARSGYGFVPSCAQCSGKGSKEIPLLRCVNCRSVTYCSVGHQKDDWARVHQFECPILAKGKPLVQSILGVTEKEGKTNMWKPVPRDLQQKKWARLSWDDKHALLQAMRIEDMAAFFEGTSDEIQTEMVDILILEHTKLLIDELSDTYKEKVLSNLTEAQAVKVHNLKVHEEKSASAAKQPEEEGCKCNVM